MQKRMNPMPQTALSTIAGNLTGRDTQSARSSTEIPPPYHTKRYGIVQAKSGLRSKKNAKHVIVRLPRPVADHREKLCATDTAGVRSNDKV